MADRLIPMPQQANVTGKAPSAIVILAEGVPFTPSQTHVRLFSGKSECLSYVQSKAVAIITDSTPVRWGSYQYRGKYSQDEIKRCNYMAFKNPNDSEWTFAFITGINWQSENSATISFILDVFQNNYYDCVWSKCYVEREHVSSSEDSVNFNMTPENIETGDFVVSAITKESMGNNIYVMLVSSDTAGHPPASSGAYNGIYCGLGVLFSSNTDTFNSLVTEYQRAGMADAIVAIYTVPGNLGLNSVVEHTVNSIVGTYIDTYTPKNKKLFQYPYNYCVVTSYQGEHLTLKYEYSDNSDHSITVGYKGVALPVPSLKVYAKNYKNLIDNYSESYEVSGLPQGAWINDAFQAYMIQNQPIFNGMVDRLNYTNNANVNAAQRSRGGKLWSAIPSALSANFGAITDSYNMVNSTLSTEQAIDVSQFNLVSSINSQIMSRDLVPPSMKGTTNSPIINTAIGLNNVDCYRMSVSRKMAKVIDDYFSTFGYCIREIKIPNTNNRSAWNYVKTIGCSLKGNVMQDELEQLRAIFDRGVTLWHTNDVGNYSLSNT